MNPLKKLAGDTAVYGLSSIIGRFLNYLLFPLHTLVFPTSDYGIITELYVYAAFLNIIYVFGLETAFFRFATRYKDRPYIYENAISFILVLSLLISGTLVILATPIVNAMNYPGQEHFIWIFAGILSLDALQAIPFAKIRLEGKSILFAKARITGILTNIILNVFFLFFCFKIFKGEFLMGSQDIISKIYSPEYNLEYVFLANLLASFASGIFVSRYFAGYRFRLDKELLKPMLKFAYPIVFTGLALVTNEMLSRTALKYWLPDGFYEGYDSQQILGIFGGVFKLAMLMNLGIQAYRYAAEPFFFSQSEKKDSPDLFAKLLNWFVMFGCLVWLGVSYNLETLQFLLRNPDYRIALNVVPWLLLGGLLSGINYNLSAWYKLVDKTSIGTGITFLGAAITIFGNYILIPIWGYHGSAIAAILAFGTMSVVSYILSRKYNPFPYQAYKIIIYILITGVLVSLYDKFPIEGGLGFLTRNTIIIFYGVILFVIERKSPKFKGT